MSHFAKVVSGVVTEVIVAEQDFINSGAVGSPSDWVQGSYNTRGNVHSLGGTPLHKNYPGIGYTWDGIGFAAPQPFASWTKDADTYLWEAPTAMPTDGKPYRWDEDTLAWVEVTIPA